MLILHRSLHIPVSHGSHDGSQVSGSLQNPGAVIMPSTIEDKIFGKPSFDPSFAKSLRHRGYSPSNPSLSIVLEVDIKAVLQNRLPLNDDESVTRIAIPEWQRPFI